MLLIWILSSLKGPFIDSVGLSKESYHINGHFLLFVALCISFYHATGKVLISIVLTVTFGITDEIHQIFTPYRNASSFDIFVDTVGAVIGGFISWKYWSKIRMKLENLLKK